MRLGLRKDLLVKKIEVSARSPKKTDVSVRIVLRTHEINANAFCIGSLDDWGATWEGSESASLPKPKEADGAPQRERTTHPKIC